MEKTALSCCNLRKRRGPESRNRLCSFSPHLGCWCSGPALIPCTEVTLGLSILAGRAVAVLDPCACACASPAPRCSLCADPWGRHWKLLASCLQKPSRWLFAEAKWLKRLSSLINSSSETCASRQTGVQKDMKCFSLTSEGMAPCLLAMTTLS